MNTSLIYKITFIALIFSNCSYKEKKNVKDLKDVKNVENEAFESFERKFNTDSVFQLSRIIFPIPNKGGIITGPYPTKDTMWTRKSWIIQGDWEESKKDNSFYREVKEENGIIIEERGIKNSDIFVICKYKLQNKKWYLIYFAPSFPYRD